MQKKISIVIPFYNESKNICYLINEIKENNPNDEIIAINDGSTDDTLEQLLKINGIKILNSVLNRGQSAAIYSGFMHCKEDIIVTMDGDGQNDPRDISKLVNRLSPDIGMVCGYRANRQDTISKKIASKIGNSIRRFFINDGIRDTGCSLKCFRKDSIKNLVPFNGMHRFMAASMKNAGLKILEVSVNHRARYAGESKYTNLERAFRGIYDLIGFSWLLNRQVKFDVEVIETEEKI